MSPFAGYLVGLLILVASLAVAAYLLNVPTAAVIVAVVVAFGLIGAWATRRPRSRPSKFTGATPNAPSLDRTVLMELKTTLMEKSDAERNQPTTRMPRADDPKSPPTTRMQQPTVVSKRKPGPPPDDD
ncbi:MAG TPA: hypothetical protein VGQ44_16445 [Gemmatimonadaceae bacterium]|jgi:hypothetical protein|nr:hypothetical protein [Gemmatimonadaceae bacterium]